MVNQGGTTPPTVPLLSSCNVRSKISVYEDAGVLPAGFCTALRIFNGTPLEVIVYPAKSAAVRVVTDAVTLTVALPAV